MRISPTLSRISSPIREFYERVSDPRLEEQDNFWRRVMGDRLAGQFVHRFRPTACLAPWEGIFNNQERRRELYESLFAAFAPDAIVETGTYHGATTEYLAQSGCPVFGVESCAFNAAYTSSKLRKYPRTTIIRSDSRAALERLVQDQRLRASRVFFYLDAHWGDDLPLPGEIDIIFGQSRFSPLVMIDDFQVPFDSGYAYDDYGESTGSLTVNLITRHIASHSLSVLFPTAPSSTETGAKRGTVVLVRSEDQHLLDPLSNQLTHWQASHSSAA